MTSKNGTGSVPLSAVDFLGLAKQRKVARIDLGALGYSGVIYVRDLTASEQSRITGGGRGAKARFYKDKSYEMDLAALTNDAGPKFLEAAVVTDKEDGALLERAFEAEPDAEFIQFSDADLVQMADTWIREAGNRDKMLKALEKMGNIITNEIVKVVREISGMAEDAVEEKKENS